MTHDPKDSPLDALFEPPESERALWREEQSPEAVLAIHQKFLEAELPDTVHEERFDTMRAAVLRDIHNNPKYGETGVVPAKVVFYRRPWFAVLAAAASLFIGLLLGSRLWNQPAVPIWYNPMVDNGQTRPDGSRSAVNQMVAALDQPAADLSSLPYVYDNIAIAPTSDNQVHLSFDVATHVSMVRPADDPLVREMLVNALMEDHSLNNRLSAIQLSDQVMSPEIKKALLIAMRDDSELSVRLKAMAKLAGQMKDPEVSQAFMAVLKEDESVQMRLDALDYLMGANPEQSEIDALEKTLRERGDAPLLMRVNRWERH